ncbi:hypothetical protein L6R53_14865 [Myxococcota bacterium]|nr:hypothetical protein [Myxococcota bacterium]
MARSVVVVGGGVAGLTAAFHLVELWREAGDAHGGEPLDLRILAPLVPTGGDGSGLGGKAMSRAFTGPRDAHGNERLPFYGPMLPHKGTVPHGYHVVWAYPNLRRFLGDGAPDEPHPPLDGGLLRPRGGAGALSVFQGMVQDPTPGGPGIALMGLSDPDRPETATLPATQALYRLKDTRFARAFVGPFVELFEGLSEGVDPLFFADLLFAREVDLELRLALVAASLVARRTDPENDTVLVDGQPRHLWEIEYDTWLELELRRWGSAALARLGAAPFRRWLDELHARLWLLEAQAEREAGGEHGAGWLDRLVRGVLPPGPEATYGDVRLVAQETERVLRALPGALRRLVSGEYPVAGTLHFRFGPDATFTSPYSYDAASAVRSLAFVFTSPRSARVWSADGAQMHRLWLRLWQRLEAAAAATGGRVTLHVEAGRATALSPDGDGVHLARTPIVGHDFGRHSDLSWPHVPDLAPWASPQDQPRELRADAVLTAVAPPDLRALLPASAAAARDALEPLEAHHNSTLEIVLWLRERIEYAPFARQGLAGSSITGLEGGWCLLADYSQGLWSPEALAAEDPFGDGAFQGSVLESCGAWDDLFACADRDDAYGWPAQVKQALADLLCRPAWFDRTDDRPWPADPMGWRQRRAEGQWAPSRADDPAALEDWFVAGRWLAWQFLRQLSTIQSLGPRAVRQLAGVAALLDPRGRDRAELLDPPTALRDQVRYVVMRNAKPRNRIFSPSAGTWPLRHVSGLPLPGLPRVFPAGDWTRNGCDVICMEAATLSGMRAARGLYQALTGQPPPASAPRPVPVMPRASWYDGLDPLARGQG